MTDKLREIFSVPQQKVRNLNGYPMHPFTKFLKIHTPWFIFQKLECSDKFSCFLGRQEYKIEFNPNEFPSTERKVAPLFETRSEINFLFLFLFYFHLFIYFLLLFFFLV